MDFMRDLKECQAEVFRRSEEKIKARNRTRRGILAVCIPLCLLLSLKAVTQVPETSVDDSNEIIVNLESSMVLDYSTAEIQYVNEMADDHSSYTADSSRSLGYLITLTDSNGIKTIYHLTENLLTNTETNETITLTNVELLQLKADLGITD